MNGSKGLDSATARVAPVVANKQTFQRSAQSQTATFGGGRLAEPTRKVRTGQSLMNTQRLPLDF